MSVSRKTVLMFYNVNCDQRCACFSLIYADWQSGSWPSHQTPWKSCVSPSHGGWLEGVGKMIHRALRMDRQPRAVATVGAWVHTLPGRVCVEQKVIHK